MIPAEAVEAAAKAIFGVDDATWDLQIQDVRDSYLEDARNALEAEAPYIQAQALNDMLETRVEDCAKAWDAAAAECEAAGWLHDYGADDLRARNPYRAAAERGGE